jgi:hypothetical protein
MNEEEICPSCLRDEVCALDNEVIELGIVVSGQGYLLALVTIVVLYLLLK